jgi:hypothetical protein
MVDFLGLLRTEFRFWRASIPVGALWFGIVACSALIAWPELTDADQWLPPSIATLLVRFPSIVWLLLSGVVAALLGAWWCNLAATSFLLLSRLLLSRAPFQIDPKSWGRPWLHLSGYLIPRSTVQELRNRMLATPDYADLPTKDKSGAFSNILREVAIGFAETTLHDTTPPTAGERIYTDLRLSAGLLLPLPLSLWLLPTIVEIEIVGLSVFLRTAALVAFFILLFECCQRSRRMFRWAIPTLATDERLAQSARGALDSGRSRADRKRAEDRTK